MEKEKKGFLGKLGKKNNQTPKESKEQSSSTDQDSASSSFNLSMTNNQKTNKQNKFFSLFKNKKENPDTSFNSEFLKSHDKTGTHGTDTTGHGHQISTWSLPLIGSLPPTNQFRILISLIITSLIIAIVSATFYVIRFDNNGKLDAAAKELVGLLQKTSKTALIYSTGKDDKEVNLKEVASRSNELMTLLLNSSEKNKLEELLGRTRPAYFDNAYNKWNETYPLLNKINSSKTALTSLSQSVEKINLIDEDVISAAMSITNEMRLNPSIDYRQQAAASNIILSLQRINKNLHYLIVAPELDLAAAFLLSKDINIIKKYIDALEKGSKIYFINPLIKPEEKRAVSNFRKIYETYTKEASIVQINLTNLINAKSNVEIINKNSNEISKNVEQMIGYFEGEGQFNLIFLGISVLAGFSLILGLLAIIRVFMNEGNASRRAMEEAVKNQANQESIDKLLGEMEGVAIGNLTTRVEIKRDFTAPIAKSINQSIESLQKIVVSIKEASKAVAKVSEEAKSYANILNLSSTAQSEKMNNSFNSIQKITSEIDEVAQKTWLIKGEAEKSQSASQSGEKIVREAVYKMNSMRENIQESAKKIKRLGESSQSIGEVTGLIRDITKQINILALNAAIHAAGSNESGGKAFSVLAQEVQRLATDSSDATKRIEDMVVSIQNDAQIAVSAMEKTTQEVVEGTRLSDRAGQELKQIYEYSNKLAEMIGEITDILEAKSSDMTGLSLGVKELQSLNNQSSSSIKLAVDKVEEINSIAKKLELSVSNFRVE